MSRYHWCHGLRSYMYRDACILQTLQWLATTDGCRSCSVQISPCGLDTLQLSRVCAVTYKLGHMAIALANVCSYGTAAINGMHECYFIYQRLSKVERAHIPITLAGRSSLYPKGPIHSAKRNGPTHSSCQSMSASIRYFQRQIGSEQRYLVPTAYAASVLFASL